jgi:hypothetical protein
MKKIISSLILALVILPIIGVGVAGAATELPTGPEQIGTQNASYVVETLDRIIDWVFWILIIAAIFVVLIAAFTFLTSAGDPEKVAKARNYILYAIVAIVVAFLAEGIIRMVSNLLGNQM